MNKNRPHKEPYYRHCLNAIAFAFLTPVRLLDWLKISRFGRYLIKKGLAHDRSLQCGNNEHVFAQNSNLRREARVSAQFEDANLTWTMSMAFYALSGGCIYTSRTGEQRVLRRDAIAYLAAYEPRSLLQLQRVVLQNPGKANAIGKTITCVQAMWFCAQCLARLSGHLAVSLLELNTFAHCISALLIYIFWWDKPYDVELHTFVVSDSLDLCFMLELEILNRIWRVPKMYVQHGSDGINQNAVAYISDSNGNCLVRADMKVCDPSEHGSATTLVHPSLARFDLSSKIKMGDTGLYLSFESSVSISAPLYRWADGHDWNGFWIAWSESGRPLPPKPITQTERWFYRRTAGSPDLDPHLFDHIRLEARPTMSIVMTFTFLAYGGLHLLAWQYNFNTRSERFLWRISGVTSASTGLVPLLLYIINLIDPKTAGISGDSKAEVCFYRGGVVGLLSLLYLLVFFNIASRAFLVIESFIALPNSPLSTYTIPSWTSYLPHI